MTGIMLSGIRASPCVPLACGHRLRGRSLPMLQASRRNRTSGRSRQQQVVQAAAASFSPDDPYKVVCFSITHFTSQSRFSCPLEVTVYCLAALLCLLQILGLHQGADSEAVQRQYNKLKREKRGDEDAITKIENAHSSLMMRNLTARMQA